ncbi:hypothetical protein KCU61_g3665, partial [Aureobasidium melanogenum]
MALRNCKTALLHVAYIAGAIWIGAHELALHNITDSDVYKGPAESPVARPLNHSVIPSVESLQQSTSISTIFDAPTVTTTEYITVTRDDGPTPVPIYSGLSSRNPYANSTFVLGAIPYVVPFFKSSYGQALTHILSSISGHPVTKAICQATASLISFLLYLWSILPGGKQGLNTLALALFLYALQFAHFWDPLARPFSRLFRRRNNESPPSYDSGPSPPRSPPSSGRPGGDGNDSPPDSPKSPKETSSTGTQTTPLSTRSAETQTADLITEGERNCLNEVARLQGEIARAKTNIQSLEASDQARDRDSAALRETISERNNRISSLSKSLRDESAINRELDARIRLFDRDRDADDRNHRSEVNELQAQINTSASELQAKIDEIERLKEAHRAQIKELMTDHDNALSYQSESSSGPAENANNPEERQRSRRQIRVLQEEVQSLRETLEQQQKIHASEVDRAVEKVRDDSSRQLAPDFSALREEVATLKEALSQKEAEDAAAGEQKKLSVEAQNEQEKALAECHNKVEALESTNTGLMQHNEALLEQEGAAKQAEEKANKEIEALQAQVDSLERSLSLAGAGDEAAAGLQQKVDDMAQRLRDTEEASKVRENELQQDLSQARASRDTAVRQQQEDVATAQRLRESEEQLNGRISSLEQDLLQARNAHAADIRQQQQENEAAALQNDKALNDLTTALQVANNDNIRLQHEFSEVQKKNKSMLEQGLEMLKQGQELETVRNQYANLNQRYKEEGDALHSAHESLKQAFDEQAQRCAAEKSVLREQAQKRLEFEKQNSDGLRRSVRDLLDKVRKLEEENSQARGETSALQNGVGMRPHDLQMEGTNTTQSPDKDLQMDDAHPTTQQTPFTKPPTFPPPPSTGASPSASLLASPSGRKFAQLRKKSPKRDTTGESKDPAQEILDWCNDIPADIATATSGLPKRPTETPRSTPRQSPVLPVFDLTASRPTTPNVFDTVNNPTRPISANGVFNNAPVLPPNPNFSTVAPGHAQNPSALGTPLDPALGGTAPLVTPGAASTPMKTRDQERAEYNARELEARQQRQHEERKKESQQVYSEILREQHGNFEGEYEGDSPPEAAQTSATDVNGDTNMAGAPPSSLVVGSRQEHNHLRSMPDNENGRHDALYRRHNYRSPDTLDEFDSPIYYSDFVQGSDAEISFLRSTMPANEDGRHDALYRGNNYRMPDDWDEFDNPVWY